MWLGTLSFLDLWYGICHSLGKFCHQKVQIFFSVPFFLSSSGIPITRYIFYNHPTVSDIPLHLFFILSSTLHLVFSFFFFCILVLEISIYVSSHSLILSSVMSSQSTDGTIKGILHFSYSIFDFLHFLLVLSLSFHLSAYITHMFLHAVHFFH